RIENIGTGMHMQPDDINVVGLYHTLDVTHQVNANSKLGIDMSSLNMGITTGQNMRVNPDSTGLVPVMLAELLQHVNIINVDEDPLLHHLLNFFKRNTVRCIENILGGNAAPAGKIYLIAGNSIDRSAKLMQILYHCHIAV